MPDADALAHCRVVTGRVRQEIQNNGGVLPFDRYMELVLYEPGLGYYVSGTRKFGPHGDFVTAPELGSLFGRCVAQQCAQVLDRVGGGSVLEFGAGSGALAAAVIAELAALDSLPVEYLIVEVSPTLRAQQHQTLGPLLNQVHLPVRWLDALPETGYRGVMLANEVLDAMPVTRFQVGHDCSMTAGVVSSDEHFDCVWQACDAGDANVNRVIRQYGLAPGYSSEVSPRARAWMLEVGRILQRGLVLVTDYGYPGAEYYHPERADGTLMCHYRHRVHTDPFFYPGLQDLTTHVDFSAVAGAGQAVGLDVAGFTSQEAFLLSCGVLELVSTQSSGEVDANLSRELKQLTLQSEMGESFKALAMVKGIEEPLLGFTLRDRSTAL